MKVRTYLCFALILMSLLWCAPPAESQTAASPAATGILRGQVTDPSGAAIANASVVMTPAAISSPPITTQSNGQGFYEFKGLAAGHYTLTVVAQGFAVYENDNVVITTDQPLRLNVAMAIEVEEQKIQVSDTAPTVDVNPGNNAGAITISGKELEALPDDPDELLTDLQALAGPSAGPNGGQLYIDGFTAGELPPKSSIREIRVNQNPFSSEYDKLGYGRIEVFTKPGTDKLHGQFLLDGNDSGFNTQDPFVTGTAPGYDSILFNGSIGGAINKNSSFFVSGQRRDINNLSAINAIDPETFLPFSSTLPNPHERTNIGPRLDYALSKNNTLTVRYQYYRDTETNDEQSQFNLATQAYETGSTEHTVQISDTQIFGSKVVNETRFQYLRENDTQTAQDANPTVNVPANFVGGGNNQGTSTDHQDHYEFQNYTSVIHGNHTIKFGARLRDLRDANASTAGFNGTFTFPTLADFQASTPSQLIITQGSPSAEVSVFDAGLYVQDDWRLRSNITFSYGLRFETQNHIRDHADLAPRLGLAWGVGGRNAPPKVVIRGGLGIFYDRYQEQQILQAERLNGVTQQQFIINNPKCFPGLDQPLTTPISNCIPAGSSASTPSIYQTSPSLYAPYTLQSAISVERQLTKAATLAVTYLNSRGFDQLLSLSLNPATSGGPRIYQYASEGVFRQNQLIVNSNVRVGSKIQLFGFYTLNYANSDTGGVSSFASNSYDISEDYGRASFDTRHRLFFGGSLALPYSFRLSPFLIASSGTPFNIATPDDLNGDSIFNDRPVLISTATCPNPGTATGITYCTPLGTFNDALPAAGQKVVPINYGTGAAHFVMNLRLTKAIGFGPKLKSGAGNQNQGQGGPPGGGGGGGRGGPRGTVFGTAPQMGGGGSDRRYTLTFGVSARNALNNVNLANPTGILGSRYFDTANSLQGGPFSSGTAVRRIDLFVTFNF
ncbi:MAG: carboxypeptidase regulatory-like domain-containing protein [Candidatus Sulfotelmatobacter sp.]